jgi:DNA-binding MarR family transcriptional regulator
MYENIDSRHIQLPKMDLVAEGLTVDDPYVYVCIKQYMNKDTKKAFPSIATIARDSGMNKNVVMRSLERLEGAGYVEIIRSVGKPNHYKFSDYKRFEVYSYDFLHQENLTHKERAYLITMQQFMYKNPYTGLGCVSMSTKEICKRTGLSYPTIKKYEKSLSEKGIFSALPSKKRDSETGLMLDVRTYDFKEFSNLVAMKFLETDTKLAQHDNELSLVQDQLKDMAKQIQMLKDENDRLKKQLQDNLEIVL